MELNISSFVSDVITKRGGDASLGGALSSAAVGLTSDFDNLPVQVSSPGGFVTLTIVVAEQGFYLLSGYCLPKSFFSKLLGIFVNTPEAHFVNPWVHYVPRDHLQGAEEGDALPMGGKTFVIDYLRDDADPARLNLNMNKADVVGVIRDLTQMVAPTSH